MSREAGGPAIELAEAYRPRPIRFLELWEEGGWRLKVYGIAYERPSPRDALVAAAKEVARARLPTPAAGEGRYGVGFLGVHDGRGAAFVFVDWWADENELHHHVYVSPTDDPTRLEYRTPTGLAACAWDLALICHEREAWVDAVLANPEGPDLEAYLALRLDARI